MSDAQVHVMMGWLLSNTSIPWVVSFIVMAVLDFAWAEYTKAVAARHVLKASGLSGLLIIMSGVVAINYIGDHWLLIPTALGACAGTWASMRFLK